MLEIEAKVKVDSLDTIAQRLESLDAKLLDKLVQCDSYFDDPESSLLSADKGLRLRRQRSGDLERVILTYKGKRGESKFKSRAEYEVEVDNHDSMVSILDGLGYKMSLGLEKRRQIWRIDDCQVCLDELPMLGFYVEVEASSESQIEDILEKLELSDIKHIPDGYASLMKKRIIENGIDSRYICFEGDGK